MRDAVHGPGIDGDALVDLMEQDNALGFQLMKRLNLSSPDVDRVRRA